MRMFVKIYMKLIDFNKNRTVSIVQIDNLMIKYEQLILPLIWIV